MQELDEIGKMTRCLIQRLEERLAASHLSLDKWCLRMYYLSDIYPS